MRIITVLAKICDANAIKLMKLHVDSITMITMIRGRTVGGSGGQVTGVVGRRRSFGTRNRCRQTAQHTDKNKIYN